MPPGKTNQAHNTDFRTIANTLISTTKLTVIGSTSRSSGNIAGWQRFFVFGLPVTMMLITIATSRTVKAVEHSRLLPGTAKGLYARTESEIARRYGAPVPVKNPHHTWYRYTKDRVIVMVRYAANGVSDRVVVSDFPDDPRGEVDCQRYPSATLRLSSKPSGTMRAYNL